jgi:hypothetical protein
MLEPDEAKVSRPVLRGLALSNGGWPLGRRHAGRVHKLAILRKAERLIRQ